VGTVCIVRGGMNGSVKEGYCQILNRCPQAQLAKHDQLVELDQRVELARERV